MHDSATRWTGSTTTSQVTISDSSRVRTSVIALIPPSQASRTTLLMPSTITDSITSGPEP